MPPATGAGVVAVESASGMGRVEVLLLKVGLMGSAAGWK
jgi:hypothetical protein